MRTQRSFHSMLIFTLSLLIFQCATNSESDTKKVNEVMSRLIEADNRSDIESVLQAYTDDVEFYPAGKQFTRGIETVRQNYEKLFAAYRLKIEMKISETSVAGSTAIVTGTNKVTRTAMADNTTETQTDDFVAVLVREKDSWKINKLIWSPR